MCGDGSSKMGQRWLGLGQSKGVGSWEGLCQAQVLLLPGHMVATGSS